MHVAAAGHPCHTRLLEIELVAAAEGRLLARGAIVDVRKCGFVPMLSDIQNAGFVHHMRIELDVDAATRRVDDMRVEQPYVAVEPSPRTDGECCRDPRERLLALAGERLAPGFEKRASALFGGGLGCTHLLTLAQTLGRALPSAIDAEQRARGADGAARAAGERIFKRTVVVDGLAAADGASLELVLQQGDLATAPLAVVDAPLDRFGAQHDVRVHARVEMGGMKLAAVRCAERARTRADFGTARAGAWSERDDEVAALAGERIMPGLGSRLFALYAERPERRHVLDALLHLGPGFLQCIAALWDGPTSAGGAGGGEGIATVGGMPDACYMWRAGGGLERRRTAYIAEREAVRRAGPPGAGGGSGE
ncbi:MAG: DUF2889 domain-containing protein [Myxococcota bacterium]|nr:DUF2889 domain-containing protein [Myxococcales bacterium]